MATATGDMVVAYALRHGVAHLIAAGRRAEARALVLENVAWLMARSADGLGIMADCRRLVAAAGAGGDQVVDLVRRALDLSMSELRQDPRRLPGQLVGRLMGSGEGGVLPTEAGAGEGGASKEGGRGGGGSRSGSSNNDKNSVGAAVRREVSALLQRLLAYRGYGFEWWCPVSRTLEQAGGACLRKITGHTSSVHSVSFSPDGARIVSGS